MTAKTKKKLFIWSSILAVILVAIIITLCVLYIPRSVKKLLPNEKIISIEMYEENKEQQRTKLSEDKIELFNEKLGKLKYVEHRNYLFNSMPNDRLTFLITYETHQLYITRARIRLLHNGKVVKSLIIEYMKPKDVYDELRTLFNE